MPSTRPLIAASLATPTAPARCLDRHDVTGSHVARDLRGQRLAVEQVRAGGSRPSLALALRSVGAALADDREPAVLEHAQGANDTVAAGVAATPARAAPQRVPLDLQRVLELQRL